ncbi:MULTISPECIES: cytochrome c [unclassified Duganella]|uniref:cytochrome c n=1 Tax=unclassified Duganella TaxID=2636909 RepID=UPI00088D7B37|nr:MULTISPECIES: cytochrome c [unclassified Duganella]SDH53357.1 Cytochrome c, mono-and diheme variants [Duganella sp. OV458]SDK69450.1 Cytochrome c, mono-and diheme variants [Duganella sp. OV510]
MRKTVYTLIAAVLLTAIAATTWLFWQTDDVGPPATHTAKLTPAERIARGAYLAQAGDCLACHTTRGGQAYAGGRALQTPFGAVISPNITADRATGIGMWSADDFWRALHNGKSRDGRLLYPAFPYTNYTRITRDDADALYAYFQTVPAVSQANQPHQLRFPYKLQISLAIWRGLYFKPAVFRPETGQSLEWNRGAYLVQGLGHCSACHSARNPLGASEGESLSGGMIPAQGWYAPALNARGDWQQAHLTALLKTGVSPRATVFGPMAEVVQQSLQHLSDSDINAMAVYLQALPPGPKPAPFERDNSQEAVAFLAAGGKLYEKHCVDCHGANGAGQPSAYPPLAGNQALAMDSAVNPIRIVLNGGFAPGTAGNPRPYSMPPFSHALNDTEVAQVVSYLRSAWGNNAPPVTGTEVNRYRAVPLD